MIPSFAQYQGLKEGYPDTFLFFPNRIGDGYWLLHDQAFIACEALAMQATGYLVLPGHPLVTVRALSINTRARDRIIAELKLLCFGMRSQIVNELPG
jgi:hypothetical protein